MNSIETIAVFGGTGMIGRPVVAQLVAAGYTVRCLVRNPEKARTVLPQAVELITGDVRNAADVATALQGAQGVYISLAVDYTERPTDFHPELDGLRIILAEAQKHNIQRVGYLASLVRHYAKYADWWVYKLKNQAAQDVERSGLPYTIFNPSAFMETLPTRQLKGTKLQTAGKAIQKMHWISGSDYGRQVAAAFRLPQAANRQYVVQGPEPLDANEAAEVFIRHYTAQLLKRQHAPLGLLKFIGKLSRPVGFAARIIDTVLHMPEPFQAQDTWADLGKPTTTMAEFARQCSKR